MSSLNRMQLDDFVAHYGLTHTGKEDDKWNETNMGLQVMLAVMQESRSTSQTEKSAVTTAPLSTQ